MRNALRDALVTRRITPPRTREVLKSKKLYPKNFNPISILARTTTLSNRQTTNHTQRGC